MDAKQVAQTYAALAEAYECRNPKSRSIYNEAVNCLPGGNTRTVLFYHPFPLSIVRAHGSRLTDADGHEYVDLLGEYTAGLYGHSEPVIVEAIHQAVARGLNFGSQHEDEVHLATAIKRRMPSLDLLRFTNSGTEATLMALAAAKVHTGRSKVLVFAGGYHGGTFSFSGGKSSPVNAPHEYLIAQYNSLDSVRRVLAQDHHNAGDLAAIVVEPMLGSGGGIPGDDDFLIGLRQIANETGAVLIFDEVMTSRMYEGGGIQSRLPAQQWPDLTTLGKWIGGGMSFGAFGGKREIMDQFDPRREGALAHAGTFNNNVLTMAAGRAGIEKVFTPAKALELHDRGEKLRQELRTISQGTLMQWTGLGSILNVVFTTTSAEHIKSPADVRNPELALGDLFHLFLLERGYYMARRGFIALSLALTDKDLDGFKEVVRDFCETHRSFVLLN